MGTAPLSTLLVRADASSQIGTGHVMRCLALAQAWQSQGGRVVLLSHCESEVIRGRLEAAGIRFVPLDSPHPAPVDLQTILGLSSESHADWVVLDGYHFDPTYQEAVRAAGYRLLVMDDQVHWHQYHANILLNQNIAAEQLLYQCDPDTLLLLGTKYVLLRNEFRAWRRWRREIPQVARKVLVTMGGSDSANVTYKVMQALAEVDVPGLQARVVVGPANPHSLMLREAIQAPESRLQLLTEVADMGELTAWADMAISSSGSTSWELAFMGLPSVLLILADDQRPIAQELSRMGLAWNLGWHEQVTPVQIAHAVNQLAASSPMRTGMSHSERGLVDGDGVDRVMMRMNEREFRLRQARDDDAQLIWQWANDPSVRAVSFTSEPIKWERHLEWFRSKLEDPACVFLVAVNQEDIPVAQVRYDLGGDDAVISVSLDASYRGRGYGSQIIRCASEEVYKVRDPKSIHAYVKAGNKASIRAFSKAGFRSAGTTTIAGQPAIHLILPKEPSE